MDDVVPKPELVEACEGKVLMSRLSTELDLLVLTSLQSVSVPMSMTGIVWFIKSGLRSLVEPGLVGG